ncbi:MAG: ACP S-malonyltransferase [Solirubrobacterales bacterium]
MDSVAHPPTRTALLFPGQGSQTDDMREPVVRACPQLLERAVDELGVDPFEHVDEGTAFAQPALFCASLAGWTAAGRPAAAFMAGHSLGELAALVAAGSLSESDGLSLAVTRGRLMQEAAQSGPEGGMLAALGDGERALAIAEGLGLTVANDNAPGQLVLSGPADSLKAARAELKSAGLRAIPLRVQGAFHSPAMEPAVPAFRAALAEVDVTEPRVPVLSSTTARPFDDIRRRLAEALVRPVRWREVLVALHDAGVGRFLETGPGSVLTGLVRRTLDKVHATTVPALEASGV